MSLSLAALAAGRPIDFVKEIEPLLRERCYGCHSGQQQAKGLRLDRRDSALLVIQPGNSAQSKLIAMVAGNVMPPVGRKLSAAEVGLLRDWIDQGARWPAEPRTHWAFQPLRQPQVPKVRNTGWVRNPIDAFVLARLEDEGIAPSPEAARRTLIRRLSLDVTGLPLAPEEANSADDHSSLIDRLLSSPHYGEKWGRHWLDLARYADSDGYEQDGVRPHAWRYRDWVIHAFNRNLPFDQFTIEQIAGDLLPAATIAQKAATGFHRNTLTSREGGIDVEQLRTEQVADRANTVGNVWLGLTFECARCHDHKYDPLSQKEYYQFYAFFNSGMEVNLESPVPGEIGPYLRARPDYEKKLQAIREEFQVAELQPEWERQVLAAMADPEARLEWTQVLDYLKVYLDRGHEILKTPPALRTYKQAHGLMRVFLKYPGPLLSDEEQKKLKFGDGFRKLEELDAAYPELSEVPTLAENPNPPKTHVHVRGDFRSPGLEVQPGTPAFLPPLPPDTKPGRLALAGWLVSPDNPLTARVFVNRIWQELFGKGLVPTPEDFGARGDRPSHPELLDWLAAEFVKQNWNVKWLLKTILESAAYRQSSAARQDLQSRDPGNRLLARQNRFRLPAELIRDVTLAASGLLNPAIGGKSVRPPLPPGAIQVAYRVKWEDSQGPDRYRRGLYTFFQRSVPHPQFMTFDAPNSLVSCSRRERSTTPLQALNLLNDPTFFEAAQALALRILREKPANLTERIDYAFELCLGRPGHDDEKELLSRYYYEKRGRQEKNPALVREQFLGGGGVDPSEAAAWTGLSSILLNLDEFISRE